MELTLFVLEQCFIKQSSNINSGYSLPTPSGDSNQELVKTLLDQIENLKKELTHKNTIIPGLLQNRKPYRSVTKNRLIIQTATKLLKIVLKIEIKIAMLLMVLIL